MNSQAKKETLVFIVADFYDNHEKQTAFYERFRDQLEGFPGIRQFLIKASEAFIYWESEMLNEWDGEFPEATEDFAELLLNLQTIPDREELREIAKQVLVKNGAKFGKYPKFAATRTITGRKVKEIACQECGRALSDCKGHKHFDS